MDDANSKLIVRMPWKDVARLRFDCFHTGNSAPEDLELASCHSLCLSSPHSALKRRRKHVLTSPSQAREIAQVVDS